MTDELSRRQYVCPSCFAQRTWNDVFFRRNLLRSAPDLRCARLHLCLHPELAPAEESFALADYRTYPAQQRIVERGVITALRDYNGEVLTVRVCPSCHYPLPDPDAPLLTLLPWGRDGLAWSEGQRFMELLSQGAFQCAKKECDPLVNPLRYLQAMAENGAVLQLPIGLRDGRSDRLCSLRADYQRRAAAGLVFLEAEPPAGEEAALDLVAQRTLSDYAEASGSGDFRLFRPTVYFIRIGSSPCRNEEAFFTELAALHPALLSGIRLLTPDSLILPWDDSPETAARAARFLAAAPSEPAPEVKETLPDLPEDDLPIPGSDEAELPEERSAP